MSLLKKIISLANFNHYKIGTRLGIAFGFLILLMFTGFGFSLLKISELYKRTDRIGHKLWDSIKIGASLKSNTEETFGALLHLFRTDDPDEVEQLINKIHANKAEFEVHFATLHQQLAHKSDATILRRIKFRFAAYTSSSEVALEKFLQNKRAEAITHISVDTMAKNQMLKLDLQELIDRQNDEMVCTGASVAKQHSEAGKSQFLLGAGAFFIGAFMAVTVTRSVQRPLIGEGVVVDAVANGDLTATP